MAVPDLPPPDAIKDGESLGHRIFDSRLAKRCQAGHIPTKVFLNAKQTRLLSVDRLNRAPLSWFTELGDRDALTRSPQGKRRFYGWAVLSVPDASRSGRRVVASPTLFNRHHADIALPITEGDDDAWLKAAMQHAEQLAEDAIYRAPVRNGDD